MEIWNYAVDKYDIDLSEEYGYHQIMFWHSTGRDPRTLRRSTWYTRLVFRFMDEMVEIGECDSEDDERDSHDRIEELLS